MDLDAEADRAVALLHAGDTAGSIALMERIVARAPEVDRYVYRLALGRSRAGQRQEALQGFAKAVRLHPGFSLFHHSYVEELAAAGDAAAAVAAYEPLGGVEGLERQNLVLLVVLLLIRPDASGDLPAPLLAAFGRHCVGITLSGDNLGRGVVRLSITPQGFTIDIPLEVRRRLLLERLLAFAGYFDRLWEELDRAGDMSPADALLCVDDNAPPGDEPMMCFSSDKPNHVLVPDCSFLESNGYQHLIAMGRSSWTPWTARRLGVHWRGALTGMADGLEQVLQLPRVRLASMTSPAIDAKITSHTQYAFLDPPLIETLRARGAYADREAESENFHYRMLIDVDGNSNSWPGLFLRLLTAACVIKVITPYRQWYYDRLIDRENHVAVHDIEEIQDASVWLQANESHAERIGRAGRALALSLTVDSEFRWFHAGWLAARRC